MNQHSNVLGALFALASRSRRVTLDDLCDALGIDEAVAREGVRPRATRREDIRAAVRRLDDAGFVDATRMRLTLEGFAVASALVRPRKALLRLVA
jgi:hypothetical protein